MRGYKILFVFIALGLVLGAGVILFIYLSIKEERISIQAPTTEKIVISPQEEHVVLDLYPEHYQYLKNKELWLRQLNDAYAAFEELVGQRPFEGEKITIKAVKDIQVQGAEMLAGNPILWQDTFIPDKLKSISEKNDLSFGPIHEIGHDFDIYLNSGKYLIGSAAALNAEQWANFKLTYVADKLSIQYPESTFFQQSVGYLKIGEFSHKYFYEKFAKPWIESGRKDWQNMNNDTFTGLLYLLKEQIGWEPFKKTFREYATFTFPPPDSDLGKVELFVRILGKYAGIDLTPNFRRWGFEIP